MKRYYFVGLGKKESYTTETLRSALGKTFKTLQAAKVQDAAILLDSFVTEKLDAIDVAHIAAEVQGLVHMSYKRINQIKGSCRVREVYGYYSGRCTGN